MLRFSPATFHLALLIAPMVLLAPGCNSAPSQVAPSNPPPEVSPMPEHSGSDNSSPETTHRPNVVRTEAEWRKLLSPEAYRVLREKGTERPFHNEFDDHFEPGTYSCAACGRELFESDTKFNSGCGWPAFYAAKAGDTVTLTRDTSHGMIRTEVTCANCDSHLGHIFDDAPGTPTGQRYCINSVSLKFTPKKVQ